MNLFINAVSSTGALILFDEHRDIIHSKNITLLGNESGKLVPIVNSFLNKYSITYSQLENLVVVNGPGSFTGIRTIMLAANTINFIIKKSITPISFFDLYQSHPIIKNSSRKDLFVQYEKNAKIIIEPNNSFLGKLGSNTCYGDLSGNLSDSDISIESGIDYQNIIKNIVFQQNSSIEAFYVKKPNIS